MTAGEVFSHLKSRNFPIWKILTEPSSRLADVGLRRRSQLLSYFLIFTAVISIIQTAYGFVTDPGYSSHFPVIAINLVVTILIYAIGRSRFYLVAATLTTVIVPVFAFSNIVNNPVLTTVEISFTTLILGLLMSIMLLPAWGTVVVSVINVASILFSPVLLPDLIQNFSEITRPLALNLIASVLALIGLYTRNRIEKDQQSRFLLSAQELQSEITERMRIETELRKRATRLELLTDLAHRTTAILEINELLYTAVELLSNTFGYSNVNILLVEGDQVVLKAASMQSLRLLEGSILLKVGIEGINGWVAKHGEPLLVNDVTRDSRYQAKIPELQMKSELAVPIQFKGRVIGVLDAQSKQLANFTQDDVTTLSAVADQLAIAIENARLYDAAQQELEERRQTELALRESEARYRGIVEDQTDMICRFLPDGTITFANQAYCRSINSDREAVLEMNLFTQITTDNRKQVEKNIANLTKVTPVIVDEYMVVKPDGKVIWEQWIDRALFDEQGNITQYQSVGQDITGRKRAELEIYRLNEQLEQRVSERTAQLEASNRELEAFAYSVSHDLRTPLRGIDGFSQALLDDYSDVLDDEGKDYLHRVRNGTQKMGELIDDILKLSQITRHEMHVKLIDMTSMVDQITQTIKAAEPDRMFEFEIAENIQAYGDEHLVRIALENLLRNAAKYTSRKKVAHIEFGTQLSKGDKVFFVRDNGAGFNMAYKDKLFVAFQRLHSSNEFSGSGVGLSIVSRIVSKHNGRIWADSKEGEMAIFYFTLG
jgi:PAS domain S-box-containing protein